ncbi:2'-5' RNA ligase [Bacillus cereus Rock1-3]|nr:2'-5' RNA ligase [Bacillus cereus Rock1-3]
MSIHEIEDIRLEHDPLFGLIPPHVTIVFPFQSPISNEELKLHILNVSKKIYNIEIEFANQITSEGAYLFFELKKGKNK